MWPKLTATLCLCAIAASRGLVPAAAHADNINSFGGFAVVRTADEGHNDTQYRYRAPGDHSVLRQHLGPASRQSQQTAVSISPGGQPNTIMQNSDGGSGNSQTAVVIGGGGNTVIQNQAGSGNRQIVTQTGTGNHAVQMQRGIGKDSVLHQRGHESDVVVQE